MPGSLPVFSCEFGNIFKNTFLQNTFGQLVLQNRGSYRYQQNACLSLTRKTKSNCYANVNHTDIADKKKLCRIVKSLLSNIKSNKNISLVKGVRYSLTVKGRFISFFSRWRKWFLTQLLRKIQTSRINNSRMSTCLWKWF